MQLMQRHWFVNMRTLHQMNIEMNNTRAIKQRPRDYLPEVESVKPGGAHEIEKIIQPKSQSRFHNRSNGPWTPRTGSVFGNFTSGIVFSAFAWFSGVGRVICICGPGG